MKVGGKKCGEGVKKLGERILHQKNFIITCEVLKQQKSKTKNKIIDCYIILKINHKENLLGLNWSIHWA